MTLNGESLWQAIIKAAKGLWTPANKARAIDAGVKELQKLRDKELSKDQYKGGEIVISCGVVYAVCVLIAWLGVTGHGGFYDRANHIVITNSTNCTVTATVSPTGGGSLSVPMAGGGK